MSIARRMKRLGMNFQDRARFGKKTPSYVMYMDDVSYMDSGVYMDA